MADLGIVVDISHWRATVHYVECGKYHDKGLPIPASMKVRLCGICRPSEDDVRANPPDCFWDVHSHSPGLAVRSVELYEDWNAVEAISAQRSLGWGKR